MKIELKTIDNFVFNDTKELQFTGVTKSTHKDCDGNEYKLESDSEKYLFLTTIFGRKMFISETCLLETLLSQELKDIEDGSIYDHGYPESRLIPADHEKRCQESLIESIEGGLCAKIYDVVSQYFD